MQQLLAPLRLRQPCSPKTREHSLYQPTTKTSGAEVRNITHLRFAEFRPQLLHFSRSLFQQLHVLFMFLVFMAVALLGGVGLSVTHAMVGDDVLMVRLIVTTNTNRCFLLLYTAAQRVFPLVA